MLVYVDFHGFIKGAVIFQVSELQIFPGIRVPQEISDQLLLETETSILEMLAEEENNGTHLPDIFLKCSLLSNLLYGYFFTRFVTLQSCSIYLFISYNYDTEVMVFVFANPIRLVYQGDKGD